MASAFPNLKGGYDLVASSRHSSRTAFPNWNHVSPRLGVSYQFDQNTVIRTGYGMFYLPVDVRWNDAPHNLFINSFITPWLTDPVRRGHAEEHLCPIRSRAESLRRSAETRR